MFILIPIVKADPPNAIGDKTNSLTRENESQWFPFPFPELLPFPPPSSSTHHHQPFVHFVFVILVDSSHLVTSLHPRLAPAAHSLLGSPRPQRSYLHLPTTKRFHPPIPYDHLLHLLIPFP